MSQPAAPDFQTSLVLISDFSDLSSTCADLFIKEEIRINIYTEDVEKWKEWCIGKHGCEVHSLSQPFYLHNVDYVLVIDLNQLEDSRKINLETREKKLTYFNQASKVATKSFVLLPYLQSKNLHQTTSATLRSMDTSHKLLYLGDIVFENRPFVKGTLLHSVAESIQDKRPLSQTVYDAPIFPVDGNTVSRLILKKVLAFADPTEALIGQRRELREVIDHVAPEISCDTFENIKPLAIPKIVSVTTVPSRYETLIANFQMIHSEKHVPLSQEPNDYIEVRKIAKTQIELEIPKRESINSKSILTPLSLNQKASVQQMTKSLDVKETHKKKNTLSYFNEKLKRYFTLQKTPKLRVINIKWKQKYTVLIGMLGVVLVFPYILFLSALLLYKVAAYYSQIHSFSSSILWYESSRTLVRSSQYLSEPLSEVPGIDKHYSGLWYAGKVVDSLNTIGIETNIIKEHTVLLFNSLVTESHIQSKDILTTLNSSFTSLDTNIQFLLAELESETRHIPNILTYVVANADLRDSEIDSIKKAKKLAGELPYIVGHGEPRSYAVVLYDSRKPQSLGGANYAVLIMTLSGGKLVDVTTYSSDFIDKNVEGVVEPLPVLREHFDRKSFLFEDAGWGSDYSKSISQIEWFLDKSLDINVDGVITVNSELIKEVLSETGNIHLSSAGQSLSTASFDTVYYGAVDSNSEYMSTLIDELWGSVLRSTISADLEEKIEIASVLYDGIINKDIQVQNTKVSISNIINDFGWNGLLSLPTCTGNCVTDFVSISENTTQYTSESITRESKMAISLEQGLLKREMKYKISNQSGTVYKVYLNVQVPSDVGFGVVKINDAVSEILPDKSGGNGYKTIGILIEVPANSSQEITIPWESGINTIFTKNGDYFFKWFKQPGMKDLPVTLEYVTPSSLNARLLPSPSLTEGNLIRYNTQLEQDLLTQLFW